MLLRLGLKRARPITNASGRFQPVTVLKFMPYEWLPSGGKRNVDPS